jgi:hypothetical protein
VIFTGVSQDVSGLRTNFSGVARADSVADRVRAGGGSVAFLQESVPWFGEFFAKPGDQVTSGAWASGTPALRRAFESDASLLVVHLTGADAVGHAQGTTSTAYAQMVRRQLDIVKTSVAAVRAEPTAGRTHWLIGADHGHVPRGGHGGPEASVTEVAWVLLAAGADEGEALRDSPTRLPATVIAPWMAELLGIDPPREALSGPPPVSAHERSDAAAAETRVGARQASVAHALASAERAAHRTIGFTAAGLALLLAGLVDPLRRARQLAALLPSCAAVASFFALGPGWTFSSIRHETAFFEEAILVLALGAASAWPLAQRWGASPRIAVLLSAVLPVAVFGAVWGDLGRAHAGPAATMLSAASGLLPAGVVLGLLSALAAVSLGRGAAALRRRGSAQRRADSAGDPA